MKKIMIFGAGQSGIMVSRWLGVNYELLGFIDNNPSYWTKSVENIKIYSPKEAINMTPDVIWITVLNYEACIEIENQLKELDFKGEIMNINNIRSLIDIRLASLRLMAKEIKERNIEGAVGELGVYKGDFAAEINRLFPNKDLYLFDTFEGFDITDIEVEQFHGFSKAKEGDFSDTSMEIVRDRLPYPEKAIFNKGYFPQSVKGELPDFCLVSLDTDLYESTYQGLRIFYPKLVKGGMIIIHDYNSRQFPGVEKAVRKFCEESVVFIIPLCDMHGSAIIIK